MGSVYNTSPKKSQRKVSFVFRRSDGPEHCAGINSLAVSGDSGHLWTASRDSLVKRWSLAGVPEQQPQLERNHEGHVDWVNDLALVGDLLVSCSSDRTLRVWESAGEGRCVATLRSHSDYVTCLAASPATGLLASGGLRGEVNLWDMGVLKRVLQSRQEDDSSLRYGQAEGLKESVYAVAMDARGALVAAGSTDAAIAVVDARTGGRVGLLRGHADNVRALAMNAEGTLLLSGSSDHTLRLWDLGQQRCLHTFALHTDSVWALQADAGFGVVYSGGRDKCVYRTQLATRTSELLLVEAQPVRKLAVSAAGDSVWAATTSSTLNCWCLDPQLPPAAAALSPRGPQQQQQQQQWQQQQQQHAFVAPASTVQRGRMSFKGGATAPAPQQQGPLLSLRGLPPLRHASVLTDRRHVLSQDEEGRVQLWDITAGAVVRDFGRCSLRDVERELFQPTHSVSLWCTLDCKLGNLAGHMETPQCFMAEIYANDLGFAEAPVDQKINFGEHMLRALFRCWAERWAERHFPAQAAAAAGGAGSAGSSRQGSDAQEQPWPRQAEGESVHDAASVDSAAASPASPATPAAQHLPSFHIASRVPPVIMVWGGDSVPWRIGMLDFDGSEAEGGPVPQWVADCVLRGQYPVCKELKTAFQLMPLEGCGLPSMLQSKLNAPRVLRVNKVADYVVKKMGEQGLQLREEPLFWDPAKQQEWEAQQRQQQQQQAVDQAQQQRGGASGGPAGSGGAAAPEPPERVPSGSSRFSIRQLYAGSAAAAQLVAGGQGAADSPLLITCNGVVVPWDFSLAAVKQWIWKRSDDLVLNYSVRDPGTPLRLPKIRPPV